MASSLVLLTTQATALDDPLPRRRENPQLWFSDLLADLEHAKAYCQPCPIRQICLAGAAERHEPTGLGRPDLRPRRDHHREKTAADPSKPRPIIGVDTRGIVLPLR